MLARELARRRQPRTRGERAVDDGVTQRAIDVGTANTSAGSGDRRQQRTLKTTRHGWAPEMVQFWIVYWIFRADHEVARVPLMEPIDVLLVTSSALPELEPYDRPLLDALRGLGLSARPAVWNDAEVDWQRCGAAVIRSAWDSHLHSETFLAWAERADRATRLFNPAPVIRDNVHKGYLRALAERVAVTPTVWVNRG